ncbi:MAG: alpha-glucan family phosphorylase [Gemmatimonadetes bacterium]|nr:alpha-glucan family phosphorylase [Gemmatimonadota bacterium]
MNDTVETELPTRIAGLEGLANNLWWTWHQDARGLFQRLDPTLWALSGKNAVDVLQRVGADRLAEAARDPLFLREYDAVMAELNAVLEQRRSWYRETHGDLAAGGIAYFCAEFGVHASIPIYSGGLGILAGDHFKEASDLGIPLVGVGLFYQKGYFRQRMTEDGRQLAIEEPFDAESMAIRKVWGNGEEGAHAFVTLNGRVVHLGVWELLIGRSSIYLMDTDIEINDPEDRKLSHQLYSGDNEMRLRQEIVLGIGGVRVLRALDIRPDVWHANEGHAAFMTLERLREYVEEGLLPDEARKRVTESTVFTTHTPVAAGHDAFSLDRMDRYFHDYLDRLGLSREELFALGRHPHDDGRFHMSTLAIRMSEARNGVSQRHGEVARRMWRSMWPEAPSDDEVPIAHVTNGVHLPSWISPPFRNLFHRYLGPDWELQQDDPALWERALDLPDHLVWEAHKKCRGRLFTELRMRARERWTDGESAPSQVVAAGTLLGPTTLTIGFARRFATYKRATLLFKDIERLRAILLDPWRPVQIVMAGKAHPADEPGQALLAEVYGMASDPAFAGRIAFVENYEMNIARELVSGVDVWLNTPRPPMEASGTSGQKAAINGVPHLSTLDGWWAEGFTRLNGWAIGEDLGGETPEDWAVADAQDAESLYRVIEDEIRPLYYTRDADGVPRGWVRVMKQAIRTGGARFTARRMLKDYTEGYYVPAASRVAERASD